MTFKLHAPKGEGLCHTCREGFIVELNNNEQIIKCQYSYVNLTRPVIKCSEYDPKNLPSRRDMEKIAWVITTDKRRKIGFRPPKRKADATEL